jgi:hypothetical protein
LHWEHWTLSFKPVKKKPASASWAAIKSDFDSSSSLGLGKRKDRRGRSQPVLPDGILPNQKSQFGSILEGFVMVDVHFVYFTAKWYILCPLSTVIVIWNLLFPFWDIVPRKIWQPWSRQRMTSLGSNCLMRWKYESTYLTAFSHKNWRGLGT